MGLASTIGIIAASAATSACLTATWMNAHTHKVSPAPQHEPQIPTKQSRRAQPHDTHGAAPWGTPSQHNIKTHQGFMNGYDRRLRNPLWGCEHLTRRSVHVASGEKATRSDKFKDDKTIPELFRVKVADYKNSGYDRGHIVPAADMAASQQNMDDSFTLSNISPQVGKGMNRDYWSSLESFIRDLTLEFDSVYVTTGPLFIPQHNPDTGEWTMSYKVIGRAVAKALPSGEESPESSKLPALAPTVAVPTHFYKVVLAKSPRKGSVGEFDLHLACFVVPNQPIDNSDPLTKYEVSIKDIEMWAGLVFFPQLKRDGAVLNDAVDGVTSAELSPTQPKSIKPLCKSTSCELSKARVSKLKRRHTA